MKVNITLDTEFESLEDLDKLAKYIQELIDKRKGQMGIPLHKPQPVMQQTPVASGFAGYVRDTEQTLVQQQPSYSDPFVDTTPINLPGVTFGQEPYKTAQEVFRGPAQQPSVQQPIMMEQPRQQPSFSPPPQMPRQQTPPQSSNSSGGAKKTAGGCEVMDYEDLSDMMSKIFSGEKL